MAENTEDEVGAEGEGAAPAAKSGLIPGLLKWVAIGLGAVILIVTIVVVTVNIMGGSNKQVPLQAVESELGSQKEVLDWMMPILRNQYFTVKTDLFPGSGIVTMQMYNSTRKYGVAIIDTKGVVWYKEPQFNIIQR